ALQAATELEARILQGQNRTEESLALLQEQFGATGANTDLKVRSTGLLVQAQIRDGKTDAARATLDAALAETPDSPDLRMLSATLYAASQELDQAEAIYRDLIEEFPQSEFPVRMLINLLGGTDRDDAAQEVLNQALENQPDQPNLLWIQAGYLEQSGDTDGAIAIYEKLYEANSASPVVANNLASLITTHRDDPESLARAANIVRRLRGTKVPAFQDTYGWIAYRRDNFEEALEYLEPAAKAMTEEVLVQYHLGMTYAALGRNANAKAQLEKTLEMAGDSPLPEFDRARETLAGLE
ncbi:MAG: tetratricopeptide repeat protein, partial [Sulfitobacter sp.]